MNAKITATIAVAVVAAMVFAAAGAVTYSWFSDSENTEVTISTATMDIRTTLGASTIVTVSGGTYTNIGEDVRVDNGTSTISLSNMVPNRKITVPYNIEYKSSVSAVYKVYVDISRCTVSGSADKLTINDVAFSEAAGKIITIKDWTNLSSVSDYTAIADPNEISIAILPTFEGSITGSITVVSEIYQGDYYVESTVPENGKVDIKTEGIDVGLNFEGVTLEGGSSITGNKISVSKADGGNGFAITDSGAVLSFKMDGVGANFSRAVPITVTLPGDYTKNPTVTYIAEDGKSTESMSGVSAVYNDSLKTTTLTFNTTHFSDYVISSADTEVTVYDEDSFKISMENFGGIINLGADIKRTYDFHPEKNYGDDLVIVSKPVTLNLNGHTISDICIYYDYDSSDTSYINGTSDGKVINKSDGSVSMGYCLYVNKGKLIVDDGYYESDECTVVQSGGKVTDAAEVVIKDGTFKANGTYDSKYWTLNLKDNIGAKITVTGGKFYEFDPSSGKTENPNVSFVPAGYFSVKEDSYYCVKVLGGYVEVLTPSGNVTGGATDDKISVVYSDVTLNWYAADPSVGRYADGWWAGFKIIAADPYTQEMVKSVKYSNDGTVNLVKSFYNNQDSDKSQDGTIYMGAWVPINDSTISGAIAANATLLTWTYKFDWNGDGVVDQTFLIKVDLNKVTLKDQAGNIYFQNGAYVE